MPEENKPEQKTPEQKPDDLAATVKALQAKIEALEAGQKPDPAKEKSLNDRVADDKADRERKEGDRKSIENALTFTIKGGDFLKENEALLPKDMAEIFKAADKEKYDSPVDKANAIKAAMIQSFFSVQSNMDTLTNSQKSSIEDYLKLTKNGKEAGAPQIFENIFEPTLGVLKQIKKAEEVARAKSGFGTEGGPDEAYKQKLMNAGLKKFQGVTNAKQ